MVTPRALLVGVALAVTATASGAAPPPATRQAPPSPPARPATPFVIAFERFTLDNGLEIILHRDPSLPRIAVDVWYHVGPANEPPGRSGFAHLFEHLMYEGSKHVGSRFDPLLESAGATRVNGTTSWDRTNYFETVPSQYLELVLWLESDRMGFLLEALDQKHLDVQRGVVKNERRQRYENAPYGPSDLALYDLLYPSGHPYHGAVIGSEADIDAATLDDVRHFFQEFYAPSNATLTIAGDIELAKTRALVERYFATFPGRPKPPTAATPTGPLPREARRVVDEPVSLSRIAMGWRTPPAFSDADVALDLATRVLGAGKTSRLYQALVVTRRLCSSVDVWLDSNAVTSAVTIEAMVLDGRTPEAVESAIDEVLAELAASGPTPPELRRARRGIEVGVLTTLQALDGDGGESGRAGTLQRMNHYLGDPGALPAQMARLGAVTPSAVAQVVREHLGSNRAVVITRPAETP